MTGGTPNSALDLTVRPVTPVAGAQRARQSGPQVSAGVRRRARPFASRPSAVGGSAIARVGASVPTWSRAVLDRPHDGLLTFGWKQWIAFVGLLGGVLIVVYVAVPDNPIRVWYWLNVVGPKQEARYGFKVRLGENQHYCMEVSQVESGGAFDLAGVKEGWAISEQSCLGFHVSELFFSELRGAKGQSTLRLVFLLGGCAGLYEKTSEHRQVRVVAPKGAA